MNRNFRLSLLAATLALSFSAYATPGGESGNTNCNGQGNPNSPCQGGTTNQGGSGGTAVATSVSAAAAIAAQQQAQLQRQQQQQAQQQGQAQGQQQSVRDSGNSSATGGSSSATGGSATGGSSAAAATGNGSGNSTTLNYERSAPSTSATAPVYVRNCRIGIGAGGSNANGSFTAAIPLGNDATCLAGAALEAMQIAGGFSIKSKQTVACTIEGMEVLDECKRLKEEKKAEVAGSEKTAALQLYGN